MYGQSQTKAATSMMTPAIGGRKLHQRETQPHIETATRITKAQLTRWTIKPLWGTGAISRTQSSHGRATLSQA